VIGSAVTCAGGFTQTKEDAQGPNILSLQVLLSVSVDLIIWSYSNTMNSPDREIPAGMFDLARYYIRVDRLVGMQHCHDGLRYSPAYMSNALSNNIPLPNSSAQLRMNYNL
jgi:hypothetical protein